MKPTMASLCVLMMVPTLQADTHKNWQRYRSPSSLENRRDRGNAGKRNGYGGPERCDLVQAR